MPHLQSLLATAEAPAAASPATKPPSGSVPTRAHTTQALPNMALETQMSPSKPAATPDVVLASPVKAAATVPAADVEQLHAALLYSVDLMGVGGNVPQMEHSNDEAGALAAGRTPPLRLIPKACLSPATRSSARSQAVSKHHSLDECMQSFSRRHSCVQGRQRSWAT